MASVNVVFTQHQPEDGGRFFVCPSSYPSWVSPHRNYVSTAETSSGFTTTWTTHNVVCLSVTDSHQPKATCLANFPTLAQSRTRTSTPPSASLSQSSRSASLVTSTYRFVTITTPGDAEAVRTPIGDPLFDPMTAIELFTPPSGLILCTSNVSPTSYHFLAHPLQQSTPLSLPHDHVLLNAFVDVPLLVTRANDSLTVWSCIQEDAPLPQFPQLTPAVSSMEIPPTKTLLSVPTLRLISLYNIPISPSESISAFLSHDVHGLLALCIVADGVLTGLSIIQQDASTYKISPSFRIRDVTSAVPVLAVRRQHSCLDALVRHADGTLSLFMGRNRLCEVKLPTVQGSNLDRNADAQLMLAQPVADEFSLLSHQGTGQRFSLEPAYFLSPLVNQCLAAITYTFEETSAVTRITALYHDLLSARALISQSAAKLRSIKTDRNIEWSLLESVLLRVVSPPLPKSPDESNDMDIDSFDEELPNFSDDLTDEGSDSDWHALLRSEIHEEFTATKEYSPNPPRTPVYSSDDETLSACIPESGFPHTDIMKQVLHALHLLYEDFKLRSLCGIECSHLARLNHRLACLLGNFAYIDHYRRDFPELVESQSTDSLSTIPSTVNLGVNTVVPSISAYLAAKINGDASKQSSYPARKSNGRLECHQDPSLTASWRKESPFELTQRIIHYYDILFGNDDDHQATRKDGARSNVLSMSSSEPSSNSARYERVLLAMVADNVTTADIDALPFGVALPLRDVLWNCRHHPNSSWPFSAFVLIGREDLFNFVDFDTYGQNPTHDSKSQLVHESRSILQIQAAAAAASTEQANNNDIGWDRSSDGADGTNKEKQGTSANKASENTSSFVKVKGDGCELEADIFRLRFLEDKRVNEVRRMLRSTDVTIMNPVEKSEQGNGIEFDMMAEQKLKLFGLLRKRLAAPVGRGAFSLRTFVPTDPTKPLPVPKINMTGKLIGQNGAKVSYTPSEHTHFQWGEFHNGVAAGLRIVAADNTREGGTDQILTRSWIVNHRPSDASGGATHAGMLLALGLGGYLPVLKKTDYIQYLVPRHELTAIGLMLGLSAGNVGCADEKITKMLCLHIRPFNEAGFSVPEFHVTVNVQTSAVLGLGLLHLGSCEHSLLEGLFAELGRKPKPGDAIDNREGLALAAGFSIGLLCLGRGASAFDAAERRRIDRLVLYANGGSMDELNGGDGIFNGYDSGNSASAGGRKMMMNVSERSSGMAAAMAAAVAESETSRVMEGNFVNTDVVSPGALMAIALIFMKTNDKRMAERIIIPDSLYSLGRVRADHVYLRMLARCLIMWDDIEPTEQWLRRVIPPLLLPVKLDDDENGYYNNNTNHNNFNSNDRNYDHTHMRHFQVFDLQGRINLSDFTYQHEVDVSGILQARAYAVAGACAAIGLKYAGSCNPAAAAILRQACEAFEAALISPECMRARGGMDFVYGTGMCCMALSLGIVCAGSGDLEALKLLRRLRKRGGLPTEAGLRSQLSRDVRTNAEHGGEHVDVSLLEELVIPSGYALGVGRYGVHMAIHMSIGFLFLGAGCQTFGNSNLAIVGLLCATVPPFPRDITDNQYHLQALRHLYVLAVEPRCIDTRDVDTGKWCSVDMLMTLVDGSQEHIRAPCIVPQAERIKHLTVTGLRYLHTQMTVSPPIDGLGWYSTCRPQVIFVKRKAGHLPYNVDPKGGKGILSRSLNRPKPTLLSNRNDLRRLGSSRRHAVQTEEDKKYFKQVEHLVKAFSADPEILAFVKFFCCPSREVGDDDDSDSDDSDDEHEEPLGAEEASTVAMPSHKHGNGVDHGQNQQHHHRTGDDLCSKHPQQKKRRHHSHSYSHSPSTPSSSTFPPMPPPSPSSASASTSSPAAAPMPSEKEKQYVEMLYDCLSNDKADAVKVYLELERAVDDISSYMTATTTTTSSSTLLLHNAFPYVIDNLMLCDTYVNSVHHVDNTAHLLRTDYVAGLLRTVHQVLHPGNSLLHYISSHSRMWPTVKNQVTKLAAALRLNAFPQVADMKPLTEWVKTMGVDFAGRGTNNTTQSMWTGTAFTDGKFKHVTDSAVELLIDAVENMTA